MSKINKTVGFDDPHTISTESGGIHENISVPKIPDSTCVLVNQAQLTAEIDALHLKLDVVLKNHDFLYTKFFEIEQRIIAESEKVGRYTRLFTRLTLRQNNMKDENEPSI